MTSPNRPSNFELLLKLFREHYLLLVVPIALFVTGAFFYVFSSKPKWKATQSVQIRDEVARSHVVPGRFDSLHMMKMVQETIHDTVRRQSVVRNALKKLPPPTDHKTPSNWPTLEDIEGVQSSITLSPPNGAEFGQTEVLMLSVKSTSVARAKRIVAALADELRHKLSEIRDARAKEIELELRQSVKVATDDLKASEKELFDFEKIVGELLIDLRSISNENSSGTTSLQTRQNTLSTEIRVASQNHLVLQKQMEKVELAAENPEVVLSFSGELLAAQPALQRLKDQLIKTQSTTAVTLGQFDPIHPKAKAAMKAEEIVADKVKEEIQTAVAGMGVQVSALASQIENLKDLKMQVDEKIIELAQIRVPYMAIAKKVKQRQSILDAAELELTRAIANREASDTTSLITLIDEPFSGSRPDGISKKSILVTASLAGLLSGIGLVFFAASPSFVGNLDEQVDEVQQNMSEQPEWRREVLEPSSQVASLSVDQLRELERGDESESRSGHRQSSSIQSEQIEPPVEVTAPSVSTTPETINQPGQSAAESEPNETAGETRTPLSAKEEASTSSSATTQSQSSDDEKGYDAPESRDPAPTGQPRFGYTTTVGYSMSNDDVADEESENLKADASPKFEKVEIKEDLDELQKRVTKTRVQLSKKIEQSTKSSDEAGAPPVKDEQLAEGASKPSATEEEVSEPTEISASNEPLEVDIKSSPGGTSETSSSPAESNDDEDQTLARLQEEHRRRIQELLKRRDQ